MHDLDKDKIIQEHIPDYCNCCGKDISNISFEFAGKRQVIDIPEIKPQVTEHQIFTDRKQPISCFTTIRLLSFYYSITNRLFIFNLN